ncbi:MAG TPA: hypothetical protein VEI97_00050, partial [bacterium]|nr:hypothetical protein [bacterium]
PIALNHFADAGHTMRMVAGRPVVAFQSTSQGGLWVAHTGVELPDDLADWNIHQVDPGNIAEVSSVVDHGGRIAVSTVGGPSFDALVVALAQVNTPSVAQDWALHRVDGPGVFGSSMVRHRGKLAATYAKNGSYHVALAKVDQPAFGSDWNRMDLLIPVSGNIGRTISTQGKLALVYPMISGFCEVCPLGETLPNELRIAWNATAAPTSALDWQTAQITELPMSNLLVANNGATLLVAGTPDFFFPGGGRGE